MCKGRRPISKALGAKRSKPTMTLKKMIFIPILAMATLGCDKPAKAKL